MSSTEPSSAVLADAQAAVKKQRALRAGYVFAGLGGFLFATKGVLIKLTYAKGVDPETLLGMRLGIALPVYVAIGIMSIRDRAKQGRSLPTRRQVIATALVGVLGYYIASYADFLGLQYISAQFERMILFTFPLFVVLFGALFFGQPIRRTYILSIGIAYAGLSVIFVGRLQTIGSDAVIGAGFGLIRIDRRIYEATVNLVNRVPVEPTSDYRDVLEQIDEMSIELPELRESFVKLIRAGIEAQRA